MEGEGYQSHHNFDNQMGYDQNQYGYENDYDPNYQGQQQNYNQNQGYGAPQFDQVKFSEPSGASMSYADSQGKNNGGGDFDYVGTGPATYKDDDDDDDEVDEKQRKPTMIDEIKTNDGELYWEIKGTILTKK